MARPAPIIRPVVETVTKAGVGTSRSSKLPPEVLQKLKRGLKTESEQLAKRGLEKNNQPIEQIDPVSGEKGTTIPDSFGEGGKQTIEIKDVGNQSLTKQLRLQKEFSNNNGVKPKLIIRQGANLSKDLLDAGFDIEIFIQVLMTNQSDATTVDNNRKLLPEELEKNKDKVAAEKAAADCASSPDCI